MPNDFFGLWFRRLKIAILLIAAAFVCWRGSVYNDPTGLGVVPVVMCALMGVALMMLGFGLATKAEDPLFI